MAKSKQKSVKRDKGHPKRTSSARRDKRQNYAIEIGAVAFALLVAALTTWVTPLAESISGRWRAATVVLLLVSAALTFLYSRSRLGAKSALICAALIIIFLLGALWLSRPSPQERAVKAYMGICKDELWGSERVVCMHKSADVMTVNFDAYKPNSWNSYSTNFGGVTVTTRELAMGGPWLDGETVRSVGQVVGTQALGPNEQVIQLRPPTNQVVEMSRQALGQMLPRATPVEEAIGEPDPDQGPADMLIYLNVATRPFFAAAPGSLLVFDGIPIAHGGVRQVRTGRIVPLTYIRGHSVEHVP